MGRSIWALIGAMITAPVWVPIAIVLFFIGLGTVVAAIALTMILWGNFLIWLSTIL